RSSPRSRPPAATGSRRTTALTRRWIRLGLAAPEVLGQPVEPEGLQRRGQRLAALAVVADAGVPGVDHLLPLRADGLALGGAVVRGRTVARRRLFPVNADAAAQPHRAEDGGGALAHAHGVLHRVGMAGRRLDRAA